MRVAKRWNKLSKPVDAPFLSVFEIHLDVILIVVSFGMIRQLDLMIFEGPFQLYHSVLFYVILCCAMLCYELLVEINPISEGIR